MVEFCASVASALGNDAVDVSLGVVVTLSLGLAGQCDVHGAYCVGQTNHNTRTRGLQAIRAAVTV